MNMNNSNRLICKGFTLIELLIVMVILGLLASLVAPTLFSKVSSSKIKTAQTQMKMLSTAIDAYRLDVGSYPSSLDLLIKSDDSNWDGPYLPKAVPKDPWGQEYNYSADGSNYKLYSYGSDKKAGGDGEGKDIIYE